MENIFFKNLAENNCTV